jgi:glycosyltransferase involved in cell wall biosynthesis
MIILFRSCEANLSAGSLGDGTQNIPRWNCKYKLEILRKCYKSIQNGLTANDRIIIIDDRTSQETLDWMRDNTVAQFSVLPITPLPELRANHAYPNYHPVVVNSAQDLTEAIINIAETNPNELIYVCEDDYLHTSNAIIAMKQLYVNGFSGFYVPYDYPDRYTIDITSRCQLFAGPYGHLRSIPSATLTIAALGRTWLQFKFEILRAGVFADDSWTWKAFMQTNALCPVPGQATHLQDHCITPYIDWSAVYESIIL